MGRKPLDKEHATVTCTVRMTISTRNKLDQIRGDMSRSEWLRSIVEREIAAQHEWIEKMPEAPPLVNETKAMAHDLGKPARRIYVEPIQKHVHTWVRAGSIFDRCSECMETKRH